jgi:hypothetical protein
VDLPREEEKALIVWRDGDGAPLFNLLKLTDQQEVRVLDEGLSNLRPAGTIVQVPQTGAQVYAGYDTVLPGEYSVTVGVWAGSHPGIQTLLGLVSAAAVRCRASQSGGLTVPITRFTGIERSWRGSAALGATVKATFAPASPYRFRKPTTLPVAVGQLVRLPIGGQAPCDLRVEITAGGSAVVNPTIDAALGRTTWAGTIPPGQTLTLSELGGEGLYTLAGLDRSASVYGPQPQLTPTSPLITITAPGATARVTWQEGIF